MDETAVSGYSIRLRRLLEQATLAAEADGILLSGGLDTSAVSYAATRHSSIRAMTVEFSLGSPSDPPYARKAARFLNMEHFILRFGPEEYAEASHRVIEALRTFDPVEVRNSASIYLALELAKDHGVRRVLTGDAFDELYAGYSFFEDMVDYGDLQKALEATWAHMEFTSVNLGRHIGVDVKIPAQEPEFMSFSKEVPAELKVRVVGGRRRGKWIVRHSYAGLLPDELLWRVKAPIESGSGTVYAETLAELTISDDEFASEKYRLAHAGLKLRNKEQLVCYRYYSSKFGDGPAYERLEKKCKECGSGIEEGKRHCRVCGAYPA